MNTHDYSVRGWGHDFHVLEATDNGMSLRLAGWGKGINNNDYIILPNGEDTTRYQIDNIKYMSDPRDQWFASASFAPRDSQ